MKNILKVGFAALAIAANGYVYGADEEIGESAPVQPVEAIGWTPIAIGIFSPVQIPWGAAQWDVFGLNLNFLYSDAPKVYGIGVGGIAMRDRDDFNGLQVAGLCNWNEKECNGVRATLGANISWGDCATYGVDAGGFSYRRGDFWGWDNNFIGCYNEKDLWGVALSGIVNLTLGQTYGLTASIGGNMASRAYGCQIAGVFNFTDELHGMQLGLVNFARECPWGFQIGLVNVIMDNKIKVLPIVNCYF